MLQKSLVMFFLFFICSSCGSVDATNNTKPFSTSVYSLSVPSTWQEVDTNTIVTKLQDKTFKVFQAGYTLGGVYPKLMIIEEKLLTASDSLSYAKDNIAKAPLVAQKYTKLDERDTSIAGSSTKIHIFQARPDVGVPEMTFIQTYIIRDKYTGYTITVSTSPSEKNYDKYTGLLSSFTFLSK